MSEFINIEPKPMVTTTHLVGFKIDGIQVHLFNSATVRVVIYNSDQNINRIEHVSLTNEEYNNWAMDDNYIVDVVCNKLGFTKSTTPPATDSSVNQSTPENVDTTVTDSTNE